MKTASKIRFGSYVRNSTYGHEGRVYKFQLLTEADIEWVKGQGVRPTVEQVLSPYVGILVHKGGAVLVPIDTCRIIPPINGFSHPFEKDYFK